MKELTKQCLTCGKTITKPYNESLKNWHTRRKFCSRECSNTLFGKKEYTPWLKGTKGLIKPNSGSFKKGMIPWCKGKRNPKITGKLNNKWKGGITPLFEKIRKLPEYKAWTKSVFERDDYICAICGKRGGDKNAHHIKHFNIILEENNIQTLEEAYLCKELWDISNGQTLCLVCHKKIHKGDGS